MSIRQLVKQVLIRKENRRYEKQLAGRRVSYTQWICQKRYRGLETAPKVDAELFVMPWGSLADNCVDRIKEYFWEHSGAVLVYGDEDVCRETPAHPWFKPDWSPDLFDSWYYLGSVLAVRRELLMQCPCPEEYLSKGIRTVSNVAVRTVREDNAESFVVWVRSCLRLAGGFAQRCDGIGHISEILFHCAKEEDQERYMQWSTGAEKEEKSCSLSIIIPSRDNPGILEQCLGRIPAAAGKLDYEVIVVDNGSKEENKRQIEELLDNFPGSVRYIYQPMEFHFSKMCNLGAGNALKELLLFLNDDVELCQENCLEDLAVLAQREYTGAVGIKLLYPDSTKIQHAGITNLPMGPVHKLQFLEDSEEYYFKSNRGLRNMLAVTAACLMVEKRKFWEVKGFSEALRVAFNDVELCFQLYEKGYHNVCNNNCYAYHHESLSRGDDEATEKWQRLIGERESLYEKHPDLMGEDPYYGKNLSREGLDTRIRPAYETSGNHIQCLRTETQEVKTLQEDKLSIYRLDSCLLVRVESCQCGRIQGYGVVLGDNNACYEKKLLLERLSPGSNTGEKVLEIFLEGQYRPDLEENMPDQKNVGLSGFWINAEGVEKGSYRIGMLARNRVTGLRLLNWTNRIFTV